MRHPASSLRIQDARGTLTSSDFQIRICSLVAPARKAPSGVYAMATTEVAIVMEYFDLVSADRAFQMLIAPSSPADAIRRSASSLSGLSLCRGCHDRAVMTPWWALNVWQSPSEFQIYKMSALICCESTETTYVNTSRLAGRGEQLGLLIKDNPRQGMAFSRFKLLDWTNLIFRALISL